MEAFTFSHDIETSVLICALQSTAGFANCSAIVAEGIDITLCSSGREEFSSLHRQLLPCHMKPVSGRLSGDKLLHHIRLSKERMRKLESLRALVAGDDRFTKSELIRQLIALVALKHGLLNPQKVELLVPRVRRVAYVATRTGSRTAAPPNPATAARVAAMKATTPTAA